MNPFTQVVQRFESLNRTLGLLRRGDRVLVAASGGPDSQALLLVLAQLRHKRGWKIGAAHLDHGLTDRSGLYLRRAAALADRLDVPLYCRRVDVARLARVRGQGIEETGRAVRYDFLRRTALRGGYGVIATAHTLDDQAETVLMRILRGTGLLGLSGIPACRAEGPLRVVRPFLGCPKALLLGLLRSEKIPYATDPSNRSDAFTRSRLRHRFLPLLRQAFNPRLDESLAELALLAGEAHDYLRRRAAASGPGPGRRTRALDVRRLLRLHPAVRREAVRLSLGETEESRGSGFAHVEAVLRLLESGGETVLPGGLRVRRRGRLLAIDTPSKSRYNRKPNNP